MNQQQYSWQPEKNKNEEIDELWTESEDEMKEIDTCWLILVKIHPVYKHLKSKDVKRIELIHRKALYFKVSQAQFS